MVGSAHAAWRRSHCSPLDELQSTAQIVCGAEPILAGQRAGAARARHAARRDSPAATRAGHAPAAVSAADLLGESRARWRAAIGSERPLAERLVHFWSNHFAVSVDKLAVLGIAGSFEREAIRPHVIGRFRDLSAGGGNPSRNAAVPGQPAVHRAGFGWLARRAARHGRSVGLNENLAREILELHTLGVDGGLHTGRMSPASPKC